ncbi:hypothetical protein ABPG72_016128 [Tetrahymena utriculariae]
MNLRLSILEFDRIFQQPKSKFLNVLDWEDETNLTNGSEKLSRNIVQLPEKYRTYLKNFKNTQESILKQSIDISQSLNYQKDLYKSKMILQYFRQNDRECISIIQQAFLFKLLDFLTQEKYPINNNNNLEQAFLKYLKINHSDLLHKELQEYLNIKKYPINYSQERRVYEIENVIKNFLNSQKKENIKLQINSNQ